MNPIVAHALEHGETLSRAEARACQPFTIEPELAAYLAGDRTVLATVARAGGPVAWARRRRFAITRAARRLFRWDFPVVCYRTRHLCNRKRVSLSLCLRRLVTVTVSGVPARPAHQRKLASLLRDLIVAHGKEVASYNVSNT